MRWMMKKFTILGLHGKIRVLRRGVHEKPIYRGDCLKREGAWTVCRFKGGGLGKKEGESVFDEGLKPQCTLWGGNLFKLLRGVHWFAKNLVRRLAFLEKFVIMALFTSRSGISGIFLLFRKRFSVDQDGLVLTKNSRFYVSRHPGGYI